MEKESLSLKWGTLKGWKLNSEKSLRLLEKYFEIGANASAIAQEDTTEQKKLLCDLINSVDGEIYNDWSGETLTKDEAVKYVTEYNAGPAKGNSP